MYRKVSHLAKRVFLGNVTSMAHKHLQDDWNWLRSEVKLGVNFLRKYFKDKAEDGHKDRKVALLEYGPYNGIKLALGITATLIVVVSFSLFRSWGAFFVAVFCFLLIHDFLFEKDWIIPVIKEMSIVFWHIIQGIFEMIRDMFEGIKDSFSGFGSSAK